jgi:hypothetical protein
MATILHKNLVFWDHRILCGEMEEPEGVQQHSDGATDGLELIQNISVCFPFTSQFVCCVISYVDRGFGNARCYYSGNFQTRALIQRN